MERPAWQASAACRDAEPWLFFERPPSEARKVCADCPVRQACLDYAVADPSVLGVWGGTTERQRKRLRRRARIAGQAPA